MKTTPTTCHGGYPLLSPNSLASHPWFKANFRRRFAWSLLLFLHLNTLSLSSQDIPHDGEATQQVTSNALPHDELFSNWSIELGAGDAAPLVVGNRIYVNEKSFDEDGNEAVGIRCLSTEKGETVWQVTTRERSHETQDISDAYPVRPIARLCHSAGRIISVSYGGIISCVDAQEGKLLWQHDLIDEYEATPMQYGFASSPWSDRDKVIVACGGKQSLLRAFHVEDGSTLWASEKGEAAFGSIAELALPDGTPHLAYIGRDEMVGVDPSNGHYLWRLQLPKPGLTNAVTPIAIEPGKFFAAGQGFDGSRVYQLDASNNEITVREVQRNNKFKPFYCNCVFNRDSKQILTYHSGFLQAMSSDSGKILWKQRHWTDSNSAMSDNRWIAVRGDGFVSAASLEDDGPVVIAGERIINDRVWAPPVLIGSFAILRGRSSLVSFNWSKLPPLQEMPPGTDVDAMNAMYGNRPERIAELLKQAKSDPTSLTFAAYQSVVNDRSLRMSEGEYRELLLALATTQPRLSIQIAEDWMRRDPESIAAFELYLERLQANDVEPPNHLSDRWVDVTLDVVVPEWAQSENRDSETFGDAVGVYLTGNASASGNWKADGVMLTRTEDGHYRASLRIPKGRFEFKLTRGSWESVEMRPDGREMGNRRKRIVGPMTIPVVVAAWKD